ncbi:hypothetical protein BCR33DRAFT_734298 [Rhizoclosmatium globosum]|uniref:Uncharacterized protein n=1 Tax=Rhizoclosmatium globosum TaxID=329046 RepID=A0A1Y2CTY2_9FUNG|nr:hypothetical protein BCR33DRAFT_734298 [Rhizoclosmatium globosum]|eukprot:ORY50294.1 hypothetical protein BCR33DRAFT_734298 [Rhizoclosmatium globosum]
MVGTKRRLLNIRDKSVKIPQKASSSLKNKAQRQSNSKKIKAVKKIENGVISNKEESHCGINPLFTNPVPIPLNSPVIADRISARAAPSPVVNDSEEPQAISDEDFKILLQNAARGDLDDELGFGFTGLQRIVFAQEQLQVFDEKFQTLMDQLINGAFDEELGISSSMWDELLNTQEQVLGIKEDDPKQSSQQYFEYRTVEFNKCIEVIVLEISIVRLQLKVINENFEFLMDQLVTGGFDEELGMSPSLWDKLLLAQE